MFSCNIIAHKCAYILIERQGKESCAKNRIRNIGRRNKVVLFFFPLPLRGGGCVEFFFVAFRLTFFCRFFLARAVSYICFLCFFARAREGWLESLTSIGLQRIFQIVLLGHFFGLFGHFSGLWDIFPVLSTGRYLLSTGYIYILSVHFI